MSEVLWRRLGYMLSPQMDIYKSIAQRLDHESVLDIGFGTGFGTLQLSANGASLTGVEFDKEAVDFAQWCIPGAQWYWGDISRGIEYVGKDYDVAIMIEVLEHIPDWRAALANVVSVLKDGGEFYISARNANADLRKNELHEREWTAKEFKEALSEFFEEVVLYDYKLENIQDTSTRMTPLVAWCKKG